MKRLNVHTFWQGVGRSVEPGSYALDDPAIEGLASYLVSAGVADVERPTEPEPKPEADVRKPHGSKRK